MTYTRPGTLRREPVVISPFHAESLGVEAGALNWANNANVNPSANAVFYFPFVVGAAATVREVGWFNGTATGNGNAQVGIYDLAGNQLVECAATNTVGASASQTVDLGASSYVIQPGVFYYMAWRASSATDGFMGTTTPTASQLAALGCLQETGQADLPGTATFATPALAFVPLFYLAVNYGVIT